jgi:hypothetical protein
MVQASIFSSLLLLVGNELQTNSVWMFAKDYKQSKMGMGKKVVY